MAKKHKRREDPIEHRAQFMADHTGTPRYLVHTSTGWRVETVRPAKPDALYRVFHPRFGTNDTATTGVEP